MPKVLPMCPVSSLKIIELEKVVNSHGAIRAKKTITGTIKTRAACKGLLFIFWKSFIGRLAFWGRLYIRNILFIRSKRQKHRIYREYMPFLRKICNSRKNNCYLAVFNERNQIAGSSREQRPRIQRNAADDDCRPDHIRRGDRLAFALRSDAWETPCWNRRSRENGQ